jgi:chromate reductase, NAD(P)H dehydrogenase (quinone)
MPSQASLEGEDVADEKLDVVVICGSLRRGSYNAALARTLPALAPAAMVLRAAPSFEKFPIYNFDIQNSSGFPAEVNAWADAVRSADALVIVSPEYNWSIPGGLKNAIDWVSRMKDQPFKDKPVAFQSAAAGILGGSRMQYHLRQSLTSLDIIPFGRPEVIVTFAAQKFDEKTLELKDQTAIDLIRQQLAAFEKFVRRVSGEV